MNTKILPITMCLVILFLIVTPTTAMNSTSHVITISEIKPTGRLGILLFFDGLNISVLQQANTPNIDNLASQYKLFITKTILPAVTVAVTTAIATGVYPNESNVVASYAYNATEYHLCPPDVIPPMYRADQIRNTSLTWLIEALNNKGTKVFAIISESKIASTFGGPRGIYDKEIILPDEVIGGDPYSTTYPVSQRKYVVEWITNKTIELVKDAISFLKLGKDIFILVDYPEPDWCGHALGSSSPDYLAVVEELDRQLGRLVNALKELNIWENTFIVVLADHGHADVEPYLNLIDVQSDKLHLPELKVEHIGEFAGGLAHIYLKYPEKDIRTAIQSILGKPWLKSIWVREDYYELVKDFPINGTLKDIGLNNEFAGDLVIDIRPPYYASYYSNRGTHGGTATQMTFILVAGGAVAVEKLKSITDIRIIDVSPTIAGFFGAKMNTAKGRVLDIFYKRGQISVTASPKIAIAGESIKIDVNYELPEDLDSAILVIEIYNETEYCIYNESNTITGRGIYSTSITIEKDGIYYVIASILDNNGKIRGSAFARILVGKPIEVPQPWEQIYLAISIAIVIIIVMFAVPIVYKKKFSK